MCIPVVSVNRRVTFIINMLQILLLIYLTPYTGLSAKLFNFHGVLFFFYMVSQILSFCLVLTCDLLADSHINEAIKISFLFLSTVYYKTMSYG